MLGVRRRQFIKLLSGAAAAWPLAARAQQTALPVVGILSGSSAATASFLAGFREDLRDAGYIEGQNVVIEARWAEGQYDRLPVLAAELVHRPAAVIVASSLPSVFAAKAATSTIPIVFISAGDPVQLGIVASLNRPGGNITGVNFFAVEVASKRLELLIEVVPTVTVIGLLTNPNNPRTDVEIGQLQAAARTVGKQILVVKASGERDFDVAFETLVQERASAVLIPTEPLFFGWREQLVALAARHALPAMYDVREFTAAGGLLSYGFSLADTYHLVAGQVARILKGAKPADLPILRPTKFELVVNLRTAKTLGLTIPESFLLRADEVIE
jgi:putative tryptophan/tyrosine transport system substrate-binding protein